MCSEKKRDVQWNRPTNLFQINQVFKISVNIVQTPTNETYFTLSYLLKQLIHMRL